MCTLWRGLTALSLAACAFAFTTPDAAAQRDSQTVAAGTRYQAGGFKRFLLGNTYRDEWTTPVRVPVLDLTRFAGGLTPTKSGGGNTTRNLRFDGADGREYVFRLTDKDNVPLPEGFEGTVVEAIGRDQVSANHPAAALIAARLLDATSIHHVQPMLAVLPDDRRLGEFREEFAGRLGMIELYPTTITGRGSITESVTVIEADSLRRLIDANPANQVDATAYLAARLMDMLMNDWDRHPGNWKWVRPAAVRGPWKPWPRDRDKAFISFGGLVHAASFASANFVSFDSTYPPMAALTWNSGDLDRRLLAEVDGPTVDSVAADLVKRISDSVIDASGKVLPPEYQEGFAEIGLMLRARRDSLPQMARRFYHTLAVVVDVHATDAADVAIVERREDGDILARIQASSGRTWFVRRFRQGETREVRIYLHGGDDRAVIRGAGPGGITLRVIGGSGRNRLVDSSTVAGRPHPTALRDNGETAAINYGPDTLFDRRPWHMNRETGKASPGPDYGSTFAPVAGINGDVDYGVTFKLGARLDRYGFRRDPWASRSSLVGEYATGVNGFRLTALVDTRAEWSTRRLLLSAQMSELEVINFFGYGNDSPDEVADLAQVRQRQWTVAPGIGFSPMAWTTVTVAPVLRYITTIDLAGTVLSDQAPYGVASTGQVGLRATAQFARGDPVHDRTALRLGVEGSVYPGAWGLDQGYSTIDASASVRQELPLPTRTAIFAKVQARKAFGLFPYYDAATVGGFGTVRTVTMQRYAGDAALAGTFELRQPIARFPLVIPLDLGVYGFGDAGRVYMEGASPGGWHAGAGIGAWIGFLNTANTLVVEYGRRDGADVVWVRTGLSF